MNRVNFIFVFAVGALAGILLTIVLPVRYSNARETRFKAESLAKQLRLALELYAVYENESKWPSSSPELRRWLSESKVDLKPVQELRIADSVARRGVASLNQDEIVVHLVFLPKNNVGVMRLGVTRGNRVIDEGVPALQIETPRQ